MDRPSILESIFEQKKLRVEQEKAGMSDEDFAILAELAYDISTDAEPNRFSRTIRDTDGPAIIAEFKRASPSKGVINDSAEPGEKAEAYEKAGARAISVLTEEDNFSGSIDDLKSVFWATSLPILRKDFIFDPFQLLEARLSGADAILLITAMLENESLADLLSLAEDLGLDALVEVHNPDELSRAVDVGAKLIGVNNRDLNTFEVSLDHSRNLIADAPDDAVMVSESGLTEPGQIKELHALGFKGFLIGEAFMTKGSALETILGNKTKG